jgi:predicted dienelactone hydrolase
MTLVSPPPSSRRPSAPCSRRKDWRALRCRSSSGGGEVDEIVPHPRNAQNVYDGLTTKPEYHVVPNAGHFAFLAPCTPALAKVAPESCRDPAVFDRAAFHREFNSAVVAFFNAKLHP